MSTVILEAIRDDRIYFWHVIFEMAGCNIDISVFNAFTISERMRLGAVSLLLSYKIENVWKNKPFVFCDEVVWRAPFFLHSVSNAARENKAFFSARQGRRRKEIDRSINVLLEMFCVVAIPSRL